MLLESRLDSGMKLEGGASELSAKIKLDFTKEHKPPDIHGIVLFLNNALVYILPRHIFE